MKIARLVGCAFAAVVVSAVVVAPSANAGGQNGQNEADEFTFYFNSAPNPGAVCQGSLSDFASQKSDLAGFQFLTNGMGKGYDVKNHSACVANFRNANARVYFNSNFQGVDDLIPALTEGNLRNNKNDNASFKWL